MNINCFQYNALKNCKKFDIVGHCIIGFKKTCITTVVPISTYQFNQDHKVLIYKDKALKLKTW